MLCRFITIPQNWLRTPCGVSIVLLVAAIITYVLGVFTLGWNKTAVYEEGLWEMCSCYTLPKAKYLQKTQRVMTRGLMGITLGIFLNLLYLFLLGPRIIKNIVLLALVMVTISSVVYMLIGLRTYGTNKRELHWSYAMSMVGCAFTVASCMAAFFQVKQSCW